MSWLKVDDTFDRHPKVERATALLKRRNGRELILGVWIQGALYAAQHLTDGHVPQTIVQRLPGDIVRVLIEVGLWLETDSGITIHDYLDYNPSSVTTLHQREKTRNRVETHRKRKRVTPPVTLLQQRDTENVTPLVTRTSRARGTRPVPSPVQQVRTTVPDSGTSAEPTNVWGWWHDLWAERWPQGILQMPATRAVELERLEKQLGLEEVRDRAARYLDDQDAWLLQHKHPVGGFIARINSYDVPDAPAPPTSQETVRIRNCPKCHTLDRGHDDTCQHCDWTREEWDAGAAERAIATAKPPTSDEGTDGAE